MRPRCILSILLVVLATPQLGIAQAWLGPKGEASVTWAYTNTYVRDHVTSDGTRIDLGRMYSSSLYTDISYGATDRLTLRVGLPYVASRYSGSAPHSMPLDDGTYHGAFSDFGFEARYMAGRGSLAVTPFVGANLPSHDYTFFAHTAPGRHLKELSLGTSLGRRLDPVLPDAYAQVRYSYTFVEHVLGISHNLSNLNLELGYFVTPALSVRALGAWQKTHGGIRLPEDITADNLYYHDQLGAEGYWNLGAGVSYSVSGNVDVFGAWNKGVAAVNGHLINRALSLGLSVGFSPARVIRRMSHKEPPAPDPGA